MEYCYHAGALNYYLDILEKVKKQSNCATGSTFADSVALQKIIAMWSVLVGSIDTLLEGAHMMSLTPKVWGTIFSMEEQTVLGKFTREQISGLHFTKYKGILSFCESLFQRSNKNAKLSISFLAPKFHLVTIIFKQDNVVQKHLIY